MPLVCDAADAAIGAVYHEALAVETQDEMQFVDLTNRLIEALGRSCITDGVLIVQSRHTTAGILVNEHEPLLLDDLRALFERLVPGRAAYAHDDFARRTVNMTARERRNGHAHCRAALLRSSEIVPVIGGRLSLGRWQRVFFVDFDGGQRREVSVTVLNSG